MWYNQSIMVLTTHSIAGAAFAGLLATDPALAFTVGLASHYLLDSIPHWEYELASKTNDDELDFKFGTAGFFSDISKIVFDLILGLAISYYLFVTLAGFSWLVVFAGVVGGVLPDFLQFFYAEHKIKILAVTQKIHDYFHAENRPYKKAQLRGILWQFGIIVAVVSLTFTSLAWLK